MPFSRTGRRARRNSRAIVRVIHSIDVWFWNIVCLITLTVLTVGYLAMTNENATAGYELRMYERKVDALREETRRLELVTLDAQATDRVAAMVAARGFVSVAKLEYLAPTAHAVAKR